MSGSIKDGWVAFAPKFRTPRKALPLLREFAGAVAALPSDARDDERSVNLDILQRRTLRKRDKCDGTDQKTLVASVRLLADLAKLGWAIEVLKSKVRISRPRECGIDDDARDFVRRRFRGQRDDQLRQPSVREFIRGLESRQPVRGQLVSIFSLMRDGAELAARMRDVSRLKNAEERIGAANLVVRPYLQFVRDDELCHTTGLRLVDVWRYFRHTWASPHKSVPGRTMMVLVRDSATPFHPVIGIAALSSASVAVTVRDEWIGWTSPAVIRSIEENPSPAVGRWLQGIVDEAIDEIYKVDLIRDELLTPSGLRRPTEELVARLLAEAKHQRGKHFRLTQEREYKKTAPCNGSADGFWREQAELPLFRRKRAEELGRLLGVRQVLRRFFSGAPTRDAVRRLVASGEGRDAVAKIVRKAKADRVSTAVADLTVCGAVAPYNELLGGKLVAMLMTSPEVVQEYRRRYGEAASVIASSMAGRAVLRPADLAIIGTTSWYGQRPCQYDRISIPCACAGGKSQDSMRYVYLGRTLGLGTIQFGDETVKAFTEFLRQSSNGLQVNSVFGEGSNPRLRKIRDALGEMGLPEDELLEHGTPRLVYGVQLAHNAREYLLGRAKRLSYVFPQRACPDATVKIARWWAERWLVGRIGREDVLGRVGRHTLVHPIRHGARVEAVAGDLEQGRLFE